MRVIDASAVVKHLIGDISPAAFGDQPLAAPYLIDSEVMHTLRRLDRSARLSPPVGMRTVERFGRVSVTRYAVTALLPRIWDLRHSLSAYDATYVALTEALGATSLLTSDAGLARTTGVRCAIELI
ncbi:MAG TPA: type II toxin-antitoxin system VapC family toxin [Mycobacteriales bacterium]|nr:type II toxin-antitoxin system VapC family toxin [Mycobacteriales bacterium]